MDTYLGTVQRIFSNWTALKMSVEHGMGSNKTAQEFCEYIAEILSMNEKLDVDELEDEIRYRMDSDFNTHIEDNSDKEVAKLLHRFHSLHTSKDQQNAILFQSQLPATQSWLLNQNYQKPKKVDNDSDSSTSSDDDDETDDCEQSSSNSQMEVDPDGWSVVSKKNKSSHK